MTAMIIVQEVSKWALPLTIAAILVIGAYRKVPVYETFVIGARDGFDTAVRLIPNVVGMMVAVSVFRQSGALGLLVQALDPVLRWLHVPGELLPMALLRPISGSGSLSVMTDLFKTHGPDSLIGKMASVMQGSTDTTLYVLTVYFGSVGITDARYSVKVGLLSDLASVVASIVVVGWMFGH